eukprot:TRINITY_DN23032_c0_g1_i1.p1 TRINITY_DN23032_c0_g1~~TRINITY_DN23032_c0_g1_i1.p1  ORF type:complete len:515 (+),score=47.10 TRINITY_DN23032_c0_g1_i1:73-1545(+)
MSLKLIGALGVIQVASGIRFFGEDGEEYEVDDLQRDVIERNIGMCIEPDNPTVLQSGEERWDELIWNQVDFESKLRMDGWSNRAFGKWFMPRHRVLGLVGDDDKYPPSPSKAMLENDPGSTWAVANANADAYEKFLQYGLDSECFKFNYSNSAKENDPAGCGIFRKSFQPLQELRNCIVEHLDRDAIWRDRYDATFETKTWHGRKYNATYKEWCASEKTWINNMIPVPLCGPYDSIRRAEEMIKLALFQPFPNDILKAIAHVKRKILQTYTWPKGKQGLHNTTVVAIQEQCFHIRTPEPDSAECDEPERSLEKVHKLQRLGICMPSMYDKADIQGIGINDAILKFQQSKYYGNPEQDFKQEYKIDVLPVCGRLALATIPKFQSMTYAMIDKYTMRSKNMLGKDTNGELTSNPDGLPIWNDCLHVKTSNCRKAYYCWESALKRLCAISPHCCERGNGNANVEEIRQKTHDACKEIPDNSTSQCAVNLGLSG